jgi:hypothetical protein
MAFPSVTEWNKSEQGMIVSRVNEVANILGDINLFGNAKVTACLLLAADNRSIQHGLMLYRTPQLDEETSACEFVIQHPPILQMGLWKMLFVNVALNIMFISVDQTFAIPQCALLKDGITFVLSSTCYPATSTPTSWPSRSRLPRNTWRPRWTRCIWKSPIHCPAIAHRA